MGLSYLRLSDVESKLLGGFDVCASSYIVLTLTSSSESFQTFSMDSPQTCHAETFYNDFIIIIIIHSILPIIHIHICRCGFEFDIEINFKRNN